MTDGKLGRAAGHLWQACEVTNRYGSADIHSLFGPGTLVSEAPGPFGLFNILPVRLSSSFVPGAQLSCLIGEAIHGMLREACAVNLVTNILNRMPAQEVL